MNGCAPMGGGILTGPGECNIPRNCISIKLNNNNCYTDLNKIKHYEYIAVNNNPSDIVAVTFLKEYFVEAEWLPFPKGYPKLRQIGAKGGTSVLGCSYELVDGKGYEVRYRIDEVCPSSDENCSFKLPENKDIPDFKCYVDLACDYCIEFDYNTLPQADQKKAILEFYRNILNYKGSSYFFKNDFSSIFLGNVGKDTCGNHKSKLTNSKKFESNGTLTCQRGFFVNPSVKLKGTNNSYSKIWLDVPNKVTGNIDTYPQSAVLKLNREMGESINVMVELDSNAGKRNDVISEITFYKKEKKIVFEGDFICIKIKNIPND